MGCSSLSHFAVLQCVSVYQAVAACCSSLSHFAVLQLHVQKLAFHRCCSSLSHFAVLQYRQRRVLAVMGCSSLSHFAVLQFPCPTKLKPDRCSSLSHFAVLQWLKPAYKAKNCCSSLSHFAVLQYLNGKPLFYKGFPFYLVWKIGLKIIIVGRNLPFFLGFSALPTAVSWWYIAFLLLPNSGLTLLAVGLHIAYCGVFATNLDLWQYGCIRKAGAFGIHLLIETGGIDWRLCALPLW